MAAPKKMAAAERSGGQWLIDVVFETRGDKDTGENAVVVEGTRTTFRYAESRMKEKKLDGDLGSLLRARTRELLKRGGVT